MEEPQITHALAYQKELRLSSTDSSASFLAALGVDAKNWEHDVMTWINEKLETMAKVLLKDTASFSTPWRLSDRYKNRFRISTFVAMYRMRDPDAFVKIGYEPGETPLMRVCKVYAQHGITVTDVTDTNRGLTLWLKLSFRTSVQV